MDIFDNLGEALSGILPQQLIAGGSPLGQAGVGAAALAQGAAGATMPPTPPGGQGALPPAQGAPAAAPQVGGSSTPPDLSHLYDTLLQNDRARKNFDSGAALLAAGFASPTNRPALINYASRVGDQEGTATQQLGTLLNLQKNQMFYSNLAAQKARLPAIAAKLGIDLPTAQTLLEQGKLDDVMTKLSVPDNEVVQNADGTHQIVNKRTGQAVSDNFGNPATDVTKNAAGQPLVINKATGQPIAPPVGPTNADDDAHRLPDKSRIIGDLHVNPQKYGLDPSAPDYQTRLQGMIDQVLKGGGVTIQNQAENAEQKELGEGRGKLRVEAMNQGTTAQQGLNVIAEMRDALHAGGNNITTGPFADAALKTKQAISSTFGVNIDGLAPAEAANKLQFQLATQATKAISARPAQMEFARAMENTPGIFLSPKGSEAMLNLSEQNFKDQQALSILAADPANKGNWNEIVKKYYDDHPIMSPFNPGQPLGKDDVDTLKRGLNDPTPTAPIVAELRSNPDANHIYHYNQRYGAGAAEKVLGVK